MKIAESVDKLQKQFTQLANGTSRLRVATFLKAPEEEAEERRRRMKELRAQHGAKVLPPTGGTDLAESSESAVVQGAEIERLAEVPDPGFNHGEKASEDLVREQQQAFLTPGKPHVEDSDYPPAMRSETIRSRPWTHMFRESP